MSHAATLREFLFDRKVLAILAITLLSALLLYSYGGAVLAPVVLAVGLLTTFWHDSRVRLLALACMVLLALFSIGYNGIKFGIDFSGGIRIPVLLEKPVSQSVMDEMVQTIQTRVSTFGLKEVKVRGVENNEIQVEIPGNDPQAVTDIEKILSQQGVYTGIVDGRVAISGEDIFSGTIGRLTGTNLQGADWGVSFSVTQAGGKKFADAAKGKAHYPLHMFLDRPNDAILIISRKDLLNDTLRFRSSVVSAAQATQIASESVILGTEAIPIYIEDDYASYSANLTPATNKTKAIISENASASMKADLRSKGFNVVEKTASDMQPVYSLGYTVGGPENSVDQWKAVGLLSSPRLAAGVTEGIPSYGYSITGAAEGEGNARLLDADKKAREIESILKGGALPVQISLGSSTIIPAPLGAEFLRLSLIGIAAALVVIALAVGLRYRTFRVIAPIIGISAAEIIILVGIIGSFTIDLAAMAGILAAVGVSVDAQILITDELLKKDDVDPKRKLDRAFSIITINVMVAVCAMLPLFFSGLTAVIGFATSTIIGSLLGFLISRPAYGALVELAFGIEPEQ